MATAGSVVCGVAATKILGAGAPLSGGMRVILKNTHATDALPISFSSGLTVANGYPLAAGATVDLGYIAPGETLWGIRGAANDITAAVLILAS
jgi:hypothetical protein